MVLADWAVLCVREKTVSEEKSLRVSPPIRIITNLLDLQDDIPPKCFPRCSPRCPPRGSARDSSEFGLWETDG